MADLKSYIPNLGQNGSVTVGSSDVNPTLVQYISVPVTSAQILAMSATMVPIIPAPGAGFAVVVTDAVVDISSGTAYAAGGAFGLTYTGSASYIAGTAGSTYFFGTTGSTAYLGVGTTYAVSANTAVSLTNSTAAFTTGTETATVNAWYAIVPV
jgi:hypothetical protein